METIRRTVTNDLLDDVSDTRSGISGSGTSSAGRSLTAPAAAGKGRAGLIGILAQGLSKLTKTSIDFALPAVSIAVLSRWMLGLSLDIEAWHATEVAI
jgi:hypothetical protein